MVETIRTPTDSAKVHWRWGAVRKVLIDIDQDGVFDLEGHFEDWTRDISPDDRFDYAFASSKCDGEFDTKIVYEPQESLYGPPGTYEAVYFDSNGDGVSEQHSPAEGLRWMAERCQLWTDHLDQYLRRAAVSDAAGDIGGATLSAEAREGKFTGVLTLSFHEPVKIYLPERWGLSPLAGSWLSVKIESETESYELISRGAMPKWPHENGVQSFSAGQQVSVAIDTGDEGTFALEAPDGQIADLLPKGVYRVTARLAVPRDSRTRRLGLTPLNWTAPEVFLSVE
ncbi:MAG: hypothetical protein AAF481_14515 [Acidobacteriota bacterium]